MKKDLPTKSTLSNQKKNKKTKATTENSLFKLKQIINRRRKAASPENGRSMVEMLGVIGIIGVLSLGGIMGYQHTMAQYKAHQITDAMTKAKALTVTKQIKTDADLTLFLERLLAGYQPSVIEGAKPIQINLNDISESVANHVLKTPNVPYQVKLKEGAPKGLTFIFEGVNAFNNKKTESHDLKEDSSNGDLSPSSSYEDSDSSDSSDMCDNDSTCNGGYCNHTSCSNDESSGRGKCITISKGKSITINNKEFTTSQENVSQWAAKKWCEDQGMHLVTQEEISSILNELRNKGINSHFWTSNQSDTCNGLIVNTNDDISSHDSGTGSIALCAGGTGGSGSGSGGSNSDNWTSYTEDSDISDTCSNGQKPCQTADGLKCCMDGEECVSAGEATYICKPISCSSHKDCGSNQYCEIDAVYTGSGACYKDFTGTCQTMGRNSSFGTNGVLTADGVNYISSSGDMTWWSAKDWCESQGMSLVTIDDIGCKDWEKFERSGVPCSYIQGAWFFWTVTEESLCYTYFVTPTGFVRDGAMRTEGPFRAVCRSR